MLQLNFCSWLLFSLVVLRLLPKHATIVSFIVNLFVLVVAIVKPTTVVNFGIDQFAFAACCYCYYYCNFCCHLTFAIVVAVVAPAAGISF